VTLLALVGTAAAQAPDEDDEGPIILGQGPTWEWFKLQRLGASIELESRYTRDERKTPGVPRVKDTEMLFRETLGVNFDSYIGRPEVFTLQGAGALSFRQTYYDRELEGGRGRDFDWENLYDIRGMLLDATRTPLTIYSQRHQSLISRPFAPTIESTTTEHGIQAVIRSERMPTTLRFFHRELEQEDRAGLTDFELVQDTAQINTEYIISSAQRLQLDYTYDNIDEATGPGFDVSFERHDLSLSHIWNFGEQERNSLRSTARYFNQSGDFDQERIRLDEALRLVHSERFETRYNLTLERFEQTGRSQDFAQGSAGFRHRLFESLVTSANIGASRLDGDGFRNDTQFGDLNFRYTKKVPYGRLDASAGAGFSRQEQSDRGQTLAVFNEPRVFNDPQPITIFRRNVIVESIVVSDAADLRIYTLNIDYEVRSLPGRIEIRRIVGGAILDGETVLLDYLVGPEPGSTVESTTGLLTLRYSIDQGALAGLGLYGSFRAIDQRQTAGPAQDFLLNDAQVLIYGADYRIGNFTFSGEREHHDSDIAPFDALRLDARFHHLFSRYSTLTLGANHETIDYREPRRQLQLARIFGTYNQQLGRGWDMRLEAIYRNEQDDVAGDLQGLEQRVDLRWGQRQTDIQLGLRNVIIDSDRGDSIFQTLSLIVRRAF
jgi:hypothetical protein